MDYDDLPEAPAVMPRMTGVTLARVTQTSWACPSQWDAWDADGKYYYLRYRSGCGSVRSYPGPRWHQDDSEYAEPGHVASFEYGHPLDGVISLGTFCALAGLRLAPSLMRTGFGQHMADELILNGVPEEDALAMTGPWREHDGQEAP